jgi:hypothetical protein
MTIPVKATLFLQSNLQGWSESYYMQAPDFSEGSLSTLLPKFEFRMAMSTYLIKVLGLRIVDPTKPKVAMFFTPGLNYPNLSFRSGPGTFRLPDTGTYLKDINTNWRRQDTEEPDDCILVEAYSADGLHRRGITIRGVPDGLDDATGAINLIQASAQNWLTNYHNWVAQLTNGTYYFRTLLSTTPPPVNITSLDVLASDHRFITIATAAPILHDGVNPIQTTSPNNKVLIRGYKGGYRIDGTWNVTSISGGNTYVLGPHRRNVAVAAAFPAGCTVQALVYDYSVPIFRMNLNRLYMSEHRTGRPFGVQAGRRPAR